MDMQRRDSLKFKTVKFKDGDFPAKGQIIFVGIAGDVVVRDSVDHVYLLSEGEYEVIQNG